MTRYCPDCGDPHECTAQITGEDDKTKIRLAEIERDRDIRIAELQAAASGVDAAAAVDIAAAEAEADTARAEGKAAGMGEVLEDLGGGGDGQDLEDGEQAPVIIDQAPAEPPAAEPVMAPPDTPAPHREKKSPGFWDNYG